MSQLLDTLCKSLNFVKMINCKSGTNFCKLSRVKLVVEKRNTFVEVSKCSGSYFHTKIKLTSWSEAGYVAAWKCKLRFFKDYDIHSKWRKTLNIHFSLPAGHHHNIIYIFKQPFVTGISIQKKLWVKALI